MVSDKEAIQILLNNHEYLRLNSIWSDALRDIGWYFILGLSKLLDALSSALNQIYDVMNFFNSKGITQFINHYMPVIFGLAALALAYLGWKIIISHSQNYNKLISNALIAITIFVALPWCMTQAEKLVLQGKDALNNHVKVSTQVIKNNITDIYYLDQAHFHAKRMKKQNDISNINMYSVDITEPVDTGGLFQISKLSPKGTKVLTHKVRDIMGQNELVDLKSHWLTEDEAYYRYSWHPFYIIVEILTLLLVFCFTLFKTAQLIMELGLLKILTQGTVFTDMENGQRNKKLIEKIRNTFVVLYVVMLILKIYTMFTDYVTHTDVSSIVKLIILVAAAFLVIDGPNIIEELFGIDAGLKSASRSLMGMFAAGQMAKGAGRAVGGMAKKGGSIAKSTGGAMATAGGVAGGMAKGALDGFKEKGGPARPGDIGLTPKGPKGGSSGKGSSPTGSKKGQTGNRKANAGSGGVPLSQKGVSTNSTISTNGGNASMNPGPTGPGAIGGGSASAANIESVSSGSGNQGGANNEQTIGAPLKEASASPSADRSTEAGVANENGSSGTAYQSGANNEQTTETPLGVSPSGEPSTKANETQSAYDGTSQNNKKPTTDTAKATPLASVSSTGKRHSGISSSVGNNGRSMVGGANKPLNQPKKVTLPAHVQARIDQNPINTKRKPTTMNTLGQEAIQQYADKAQKVHDKVQNSRPGRGYNKFYDLTKNTILKNNGNGQGGNES